MFQFLLQYICWLCASIIVNSRQVSLGQASIASSLLIRRISVMYHNHKTNKYQRHLGIKEKSVLWWRVMVCWCARLSTMLLWTSLITQKLISELYSWPSSLDMKKHEGIMVVSNPLYLHLTLFISRINFLSKKSMSVQQNNTLPTL